MSLYYFECLLQLFLYSYSTFTISVLSPVSLLMGLSGSGSNTQSLHLGESRPLNDGRGEASDLALNSQFVSADSAWTAQAHWGVAQRGEILAAAITKSQQSSASAGDSAMVIVDDESEKEEKGNEVDRLVTSSDGMAMSSTEEEINPPLHPPPPPPPPPQPPP